MHTPKGDHATNTAQNMGVVVVVRAMLCLVNHYRLQYTDEEKTKNTGGDSRLQRSEVHQLGLE